MKVLVTGGAGYIGSTLVGYLLDAGHEVTVVDNFMYDTTSLNHFCAHPKFDVHRADVRVREQIAPFLKTADIVITLASIVGAPACNRDPVAAKTINNDAIMMMFKELSREQVVLMPTTNSAYGSGNEDNFCDETTPLNPISTYALDKVEVEKALMDRENSISFRLATVFGMSPQLRLDLLVNDFTYRAYRDGASCCSRATSSVITSMSGMYVVPSCSGSRSWTACAARFSTSDLVLQICQSSSCVRPFTSMFLTSPLLNPISDTTQTSEITLFRMKRSKKPGLSLSIRWMPASSSFSKGLGCFAISPMETYRRYSEFAA